MECWRNCGYSTSNYFELRKHEVWFCDVDTFECCWDNHTGSRAQHKAMHHNVKHVRKGKALVLKVVDDFQFQEHNQMFRYDGRNFYLKYKLTEDIFYASLVAFIETHGAKY